MRLLYNFIFSLCVSNFLKRFLFLVGTMFVSFSGYSQVVVGFSTTASSDFEASGILPTFLLTGNVSVATTVTIQTGGTAVFGVDYTIASTTINIPLGNYPTNTPLTIGIDIIDDFIAESDDTLDLRITATSGNAFIGFVGSTSYTITNDDIAGVNIDTLTGTTTEAGGTAEFLFTLTSEPTDDVRINTNGYVSTENTGPSSIIIEPQNWSTGTTLIITGVDDAIYDGDHVDIINTGNVVSNDPFYDLFVAADLPQLTVTNLDDEVPTVSLSATDAVAAENTPANATGLFTIDLGAPNPNTAPVVVNYTISGTAVNGTDYTTIANSVSILSGQQVATVLIEPVDDTVLEVSEDVTLTLSPGIGYVIATAPDNTATVDITDNDVAIVSINDPSSVVEGNIGTATLNFTVSITESDPLNPITLDYTVSGGNENGSTLPLTFTAGVTGVALSQTVSVTTNGDLEIEPNETVSITLSNPSANAVISGTNNIGSSSFTDDDICAGGATAPPINGNPTAFCDTSNINLNNFVVGGTGSAPINSTLEWSTIPNPTSDSDLISTSVVETSDTYYGVYWDDLNDCANASSPVNIVFSTTPNIDADDTTTACNNSDTTFGATSVDLNLFSTGSAAGDWAFTSGPTSVLPNGGNLVRFSNQVAGTYIYTYTTNTATGACSDQSFTVTITVADCDPCIAGNTAPTLNTFTPTVFCDDINVSLNDYINNTPPAGTTLEWSTVSDPESPTAIFLTPIQIADPNPGTVYGFFWDAVNSCASPTLAITIVLNMTPEITATIGNERCGPGSIDLTVAGNTPGAVQPPTFNWYASDNPADANILDSGTTFSTPGILITTIYYVEATANNCTSSRVPVVATISPIQSAGTPTDTSSCSNADNGPTTIDLDDQLMGESIGVWTFTSGPENVPTDSDDNEVDFSGRPDGDYVFTFTTTEAEAPCVNESSMVTISVNDCDVDTDLDGLFDGPEAILGTNPNNPDTDGDLINDADEVGIDIDNPIDTDEDGIIDALESNILDSDMDGVVDQLDPANDNPCLPNRFNGACDTDGDGISDLDEQTNGSNPDDPCDPNATPDCDTPIDLEVLKTVNNENAVVGEQVVFTITVNNLSDRTVKSVQIGELLESGFEYIEDTASIGTYDEQTGNWDINEMQPLESISLEIIVEVLADGTYSNTAELLQSFPIDGTRGNDSATITLNIALPEGVDLVVEKTVDSANPLVNDEVIFTIKVTNVSIEDVVSQIEVSDILDTNGFEYIGDSATIGDYDENIGIWMIPSLDLGQEATLTITVVVPNEGSYINTATITRSSPADGILENNTSSVDVNVSLPTPAEVGIVFNQFSPNGDGTNDILKINRRDSQTNLDVDIIYDITIFDRYGNEIFEAQNKIENEVWDGTYKGEEVPNGTYFYILNIDIGAGAQIKKGWIQLIR